MISVTRWKHFQHYGKSKPPWIKLYRDTLHDFETMNRLEPAERWVLVGLWMLAATHDNEIPNDCAYLSRSLNADVTPDLIKKLQTLGKIEVGASSRLTLDKPLSKAEAEAEAEESSVDLSTGASPDVENSLSRDEPRSLNNAPDSEEEWGDFAGWFMRGGGKEKLWGGRQPPKWAHQKGRWTANRDLDVCSKLVKNEGVTIDELRALVNYEVEGGATMQRYHGSNGRPHRNEALGTIDKKQATFGGLSVQINR